MNTPAMTKIASCYKPTPSKWSISVHRDNTDHRDNLLGRFVLTHVFDDIGQMTERYKTEDAAIDAAVATGYTEVIRGGSVRYKKHAKVTVHGDSPGGVSGKLPPIPDGEVVTVFEDYGQAFVNVMRDNGQLRTVRRECLS